MGIPSISELTLETSKRHVQRLTTDDLRALISNRKFILAYNKFAVSTALAQRSFADVIESKGPSFEFHTKMFHKIIARHGDELGLSAKTLEWLLNESVHKEGNQLEVNKFIKKAPVNLSKCVDTQRYKVSMIYSF